MDKNTLWKDVVDFSWYTTERLTSFPDTHPMSIMGYKLAKHFNNMGADATWAELKKQSPDVPIVFLRFFEESLFPQKFAKYAPNATVEVIRHLLSKQYYAYEGFGLGGGDYATKSADIRELSRDTAWQRVYDNRKMLELYKGETKKIAWTPENSEWYLFSFNTRTQISVASTQGISSIDEITIEVKGKPSTTQILEALRVSLQMAYDPFKDVQDFYYRTFARHSGRTLEGIRKALEGSGIKSVARDKFTSKGGEEIPFSISLTHEDTHYIKDGRHVEEGKGEKVECYIPHVRMKAGTDEVMKVALLAWAFGQKLK